MRVVDVGIYLGKLPPTTRPMPALPPPKTIMVAGRQHRLLDVGTGPLTFVLVHGNPTNLLLWRHFIGPLSARFRVIAVDLLTTDDRPTSDNLHDIDADVDVVLAALDDAGVDDVILVGHDWGVSIILEVWERLRGHPRLRVRGLSFFEGLLYPLRLRDHNVVAWAIARLLQLPLVGWLLLVELNLFIRVLLPLGCRRRLRPDELALFADRFRTRASRRAIWRWVQTVPGSRRHPLWARVDHLREALFASTIPKLWFYARPGFATCARSITDTLGRCRALRAVDVGDGVHYLGEDDPDLLVRHLLAFADELTTSRPLQRPGDTA